jgi:zinc transport system permease protein
MIEPFLARALAAAIGLAIVAAPLGSLVVWNRMAYFGETIAQASLVGIALALMLEVNLTLSVILVTLAAAGLMILMSRQRAVPLDSILGLMHHGALALGVIAMSMLRGPPVDLIGYLFGDIFAVGVVRPCSRLLPGSGSRSCASPYTRSWRRPKASAATRSRPFSSSSSRSRSPSP